MSLIKITTLCPLHSIKCSAGTINRSMGNSNAENPKKNSERLKLFRQKLKTEIPKNMIQDPISIKIDPKTEEFTSEVDKNPTKWGDWQHNGRKRKCLPQYFIIFSQKDFSDTE